MSMDEVTEFELEKWEYRSIMDALEHSQENAIHEDARSKFWATRETLLEQFEAENDE